MREECDDGKPVEIKLTKSDRKIDKIITDMGIDNTLPNDLAIS